MHTAHTTENEQPQEAMQQFTYEQLSDIELQSISGGAPTVNVV